MPVPESQTAHRQRARTRTVPADAPSLVVKWFDVPDAPCGVCGVEVPTAIGPRLYVEGTTQPACGECGRAHAADLARLVDAMAARLRSRGRLTKGGALGYTRGVGYGGPMSPPTESIAAADEASATACRTEVQARTALVDRTFAR